VTTPAPVPLHPPAGPAPRCAAANLPEFLTPEQAAELLQLPVSWIYRQGRRLKAGEPTDIPLVKFGKYLRIPRAALLAGLPGTAQP
jgi:hypothetical protein